MRKPWPRSKVKAGQVNEITYAKGGSTVNAYICAEEGMWEGSTSWL